MKTEISIIVPVYNSEKYISECIESVLAQTANNYELILLDDASTDNSANIIDYYQKENGEKISVYHFKKNEKQGKARNVGIKNAKGRYIIFLDSDDTLDRFACEMLYNKAEEETSDIVFCDYEIIGGKIKNEYCTHVDVEYMGNLTDAKRKALITTSVVPWAKLIKKKLIVDNDIFFPEGKSYEDRATTYLYYLYANKVAKVEKPLYKYRIVEDSTTNQKNKNRHYEALEMGETLIYRFKERQFFEKFYQEIEYFAIEQLYCQGIINAQKQFDCFPKQYANRLLKTLLLEFPDFEKNTYFKRYMSEAYVMMLRSHMYSSDNLIKFLNDDISNMCPNYTYKLMINKSKLESLEKCVLEKKYVLGLWGAGKYGNLIIRCFREYNMKFTVIYDMNLEKIGTSYNAIDVKDYKTDKTSNILLIVPFCNWMHSVQSELVLYNRKIDILNLEVYIKHDLGLCIRKLVTS